MTKVKQYIARYIAYVQIKYRSTKAERLGKRHGSIVLYYTCNVQYLKRDFDTLKIYITKSRAITNIFL